VSSRAAAHMQANTHQQWCCGAAAAAVLQQNKCKPAGACSNLDTAVYTYATACKGAQWHKSTHQLHTPGFWALLRCPHSTRSSPPA
jgi:hypothetical protein